MNNYLVTGGLGFIGSHLVQKLLQNKDNRVWVIDDGSNTSWNPRKGKINYGEQTRDLLVPLMGGYEVNDDPRIPNLVSISGSCTHHNILDRIRAGRFRAVYHLAADTSVVKSIEDPIQTLDRNVAKTLYIAKACAEGSTRLVFSSSAAVYADAVDDTPIRESSIKSPTSPYGLSKLTCENWLKAYKDIYGLEYVALRYFNAYGERQLGGSPYAGVIGNWIHAAHFDKPIVIYGDGKQSRDFIHVSDIVEANIKAIEVEPNHVFNICNKKETSLIDVLAILEKEITKPIKTKFENPREGEVRVSVGDNSFAKELLNWSPQVNLAEGIKKTLLWRGIK
tara:strand:+ start:1059 stop:2066 length:1008 start_codon:yes stop_codon:yes gene_type:complete